LSIDEQHVALPKLYGAPAYARPAAPVDLTPRPFDPDELPLEMDQTPEEHRYASSLPARAYGTTGSHGLAQGGGTNGSGGLQPRPFSLRAIAGRLLGGSN
jgi:hypothetical protein